MLDLLKIFAVFLFILFLLRKKVQVGYTLLIASAMLIVLYFPTPDKIMKIIKNTLFAHITFVLLIALSTIRMFEMILRENRVLDEMMKTMEAVLKNKKLVTISMPLLIGMMPSVGGAYFSAPMVEEATRDINLSAEEKSFANYWYRHPWEFILPLYPGIVLASAITSIQLRTLILMNLPYALAMFFAGFQFIRAIKGKRNPTSKYKPVFLSFVPLLILLLMVIVLNIQLQNALLMIVIGLLLYYRYPINKTLKVIKHGFSLNIIFLILGVVCFKETLEVSGAVNNISAFFKENNIPLLPVIFMLPFITGILTGITVGFVSSTFPLILSLAGTSPHVFSFAFAAGYVGVLLSPVHVCLILTREYFRADMLLIYRKILPATLAIMLIAIIEYLFYTY
ncbi:MAG: DUF401 family protein [Nitrospirae bacterium]|nr:DUF401 family protein [Nitrospirota bacterium]